MYPGLQRNPGFLLYRGKILCIFTAGKRNLRATDLDLFSLLTSKLSFP